MPSTRAPRYPIPTIFLICLAIFICSNAIAQEAPAAQERSAADQQANETPAEAIAENENVKTHLEGTNIPQELGASILLHYDDKGRIPLLKYEQIKLRGSPEILTLGAPPHDFSAIWQDDLSGNPLGAALVITPVAAGPSSASLQNLQYFLATRGWASLTISTIPHDPAAIPSASPLPKPTPKKDENAVVNDTAEISEVETKKNPEVVDESQVVFKEESNQQDNQTPKETTSEPEDKPEAEAPEPTSAEIMITRIELSAKELAKRNFFNNAIISFQSSTRYLVDYFDFTGPDPSDWRALVLVDAAILVGQNNRTLDALFSVNTPILDIITDSDDLSEFAQNERSLRAKQLKSATYVKKKILLSQLNTERENTLTRTIRGFITRYAAGTEEKQ